MASKKKGCEWCEAEVFSEYKEHSNGYCLWYEVYPLNQTIAVIAQANNEEGELIEDYVEIPMNFCPNCGRKLT